jgi:hypothetical protein
MNIRTACASATLIGLTLPLLALAPATAADGEVIREGNCTGASDWKVKAKPDDGRYEVEGEVESNRVGQAWSWRIRHNGTTEARGTARTAAPSGSFSIERRLSNRAGTDKFAFRAVNSATGEVCKGSVTI